MDISGPIRVLLPKLLTGPPKNTSAPPDPLVLLAQSLAFPEHIPDALPNPEPAAASSGIPQPQPARPVYGHLAMGACLRLLPRLSRDHRESLAAALGDPVKSLLENAQRLLAPRALAVDILWHYWLLVLSQQHLGLAVPEFLLKTLWQRAWPARRPDGPLHPVTADSVLDTVVYHDLCALHAAYNAILLTRDFDLFPDVQRLVDWHVANTQPDHITTEPWALAAFASLDGTATFAPQQLHDTTTHATAHGATPVVLALLADALAAQEDIANL